MEPVGSRASAVTSRQSSVGSRQSASLILGTMPVMMIAWIYWVLVASACACGSIVVSLTCTAVQRAAKVKSQNSKVKRPGKNETAR